MPGLQIEIADNHQKLGQNVTDVEILTVGRKKFLKKIFVQS